MIIYYHWNRKRVVYDGWFLFGIIPLYIRRFNLDTPGFRQLNKLD